MFSYIAGWFCTPKETMVLPVKNELKVKPPLDAEGLTLDPFEEILDLAFQNIQGCAELQSFMVTRRYSIITHHLLNEFEKTSRIYAINCFACQQLKDPTIKTDEKKWEELFAKMEGVIKKGMEEIENCSNAILAGCLVQAGVPISLTHYLGFPKPIYFDDAEEISSNYLARLITLVPERLPTVQLMQKNSFDMLKVTYFKCGVSFPARLFIENEVLKLMLAKC